MEHRQLPPHSQDEALVARPASGADEILALVNTAPRVPPGAGFSTAEHEIGLMSRWLRTASIVQAIEWLVGHSASNSPRQPSRRRRRSTPGVLRRPVGAMPLLGERGAERKAGARADDRSRFACLLRDERYPGRLDVLPRRHSGRRAGPGDGVSRHRGRSVDAHGALDHWYSRSAGHAHGCTHRPPTLPGAPQHPPHLISPTRG